jgi:sterol desaturase/sphingolipid hydroxylase (fatty acid hydroxylase superfamily)
MMQSLWMLLVALAVTQVPVVVVLAIFTLLERFVAPHRPPPAAKLLYNLAVYLFSMVFVFLTWPTVARAIDWLRAHLGITPLAAGGVGRRMLLGFAWLVMWDLLQYWVHRAQHAIPFLWESHRLHHSDDTLTASTSLRAHAIGQVLLSFTITLPLYVLFNGFEIPDLVLWVVFYAYSAFSHMNAHLGLGPLTPVLVGPQTHRIHHSRLPEHRDRNFAAFFPLLDILFGTWHRPRRDEYPPVGLVAERAPDSLAAATWMPLAAWLRPLTTGRRRR